MQNLLFLRQSAILQKPSGRAIVESSNLTEKGAPRKGASFVFFTYDQCRCIFSADKTIQVPERGLGLGLPQGKSGCCASGIPEFSVIRIADVRQLVEPVKVPEGRSKVAPRSKDALTS